MVEPGTQLRRCWSGLGGCAGASSRTGGFADSRFVLQRLFPAHNASTEVRS